MRTEGKVVFKEPFQVKIVRIKPIEFIELSL